MKSKQKLPISNVGITTIITVFIVLSLVTFASLSYVNAKNDYNLSKQVASHNDSYFDACNQANAQIAITAQELEAAYHTGTTEALSSIQGEYNYDYPVGDSHRLYVTIVPTITADTILDGMTPVAYLNGNALSTYSITRFEVVTTEEWNGDDNFLPLQQ